MSKLLTCITTICIVLAISGCGVENKEIAVDQSGKTIDSVDTTYTDAIVSSPRHQEWVEINNNGKIIHAWVVYPEVSEPTSVVLVIHENKGLNDWARQMADEIAAAGYIAIAPDLLSNISSDKTRTSDFSTEDEATQALYTLKPEDVISDLQAVELYADTIQGSNGKLASVGFCRGGSQSFRYATASKGINHTFVFYGSAPEESTIFENIAAPVTAYYGGDDARINVTIDQTKINMDQYNKLYTYEIYPGAGHAFMRNALLADASQENKDARTKAFADMLLKLQDL